MMSTDMIVDFNVIRNIDTPKFQNDRYFVTIKDSTPAGTSIYRVTAQDKVRGKLFLHRLFYDTSFFYVKFEIHPVSDYI